MTTDERITEVIRQLENAKTEFVKYADYPAAAAIRDAMDVLKARLGRRSMTPERLVYIIGVVTHAIEDGDGRVSASIVSELIAEVERCWKENKETQCEPQ